MIKAAKGQGTMNIKTVRTCACFNLRKAARAVTQLYDEVLAPSGLRGTQFSVLAVIAAAGPATMTDLADTLVMDRTTLTRNLKPLLGRGLVERGEGEDRRQRPIAITAAGREALDQALPPREKAQARIAGGLGPARWKGMVEDLNTATRLAPTG